MTQTMSRPDATGSQSAQWLAVCALSYLIPDRGACALVEGRQVAMFLLSDGSLYAIGNYDPFSNANVLSRGIVGDKSGRPKVASPVYKHSFYLDDGRCTDDADVRVETYGVRVTGTMVEVLVP